MLRISAQRDRRLYLFGAGHVGRALVLALAPLPFEILGSIRVRRPFLALRRPMSRSVVAVNPVNELNNPPAGSFVFVMSHSHALDLAMTDAALRQSLIAHVGLIGSASKRARFERRLREGGVEEARIAGLMCPIGLAGIESKEPAIIAAATAAQLLVLDEKLKARY